jgi:hypothetical protein
VDPMDNDKENDSDSANELSLSAIELLVSDAPAAKKKPKPTAPSMAGRGGGGSDGTDSDEELEAELEAWRSQRRRRYVLGDAKSSRGVAKSSLGDAKRSLGVAKSSRGVAKSSLGDAKSSLGDAKSSRGVAKSSLGDAKSSLGDAKSSRGVAKSSLGDAKSSLGLRVRGAVDRSPPHPRLASPALPLRRRCILSRPRRARARSPPSWSKWLLRRRRRRWEPSHNPACLRHPHPSCPAPARFEPTPPPRGLFPQAPVAAVVAAGLTDAQRAEAEAEAAARKREVAAILAAAETERIAILKSLTKTAEGLMPWVLQQSGDAPPAPPVVESLPLEEEAEEEVRTPCDCVERCTSTQPGYKHSHGCCGPPRVPWCGATVSYCISHGCTHARTAAGSPL